MIPFVHCSQFWERVVVREDHESKMAVRNGAGGLVAVPIFI